MRGKHGRGKRKPSCPYDTTRPDRRTWKKEGDWEKNWRENVPGEKERRPRTGRRWDMPKREVRNGRGPIREGPGISGYSVEFRESPERDCETAEEKMKEEARREHGHAIPKIF